MEGRSLPTPILLNRTGATQSSSRRVSELVVPKVSRGMQGRCHYRSIAKLSQMFRLLNLALALCHARIVFYVQEKEGTRTARVSRRLLK